MDDLVVLNKKYYQVKGVINMSEYDSDLEPLLTIISIENHFEVFPFLDKQAITYSDSVLTNVTAKKEIHSFIKNIVNTIVSNMLSTQYLSKLTTKYFTPEGLNLVIFYFIFEKALEHLKEKLHK
jgi:uncharacterized protein with von Willebrand factor type A (vWA) domain